jgi:hypothetical protein
MIYAEWRIRVLVRINDRTPQRLLERGIVSLRLPMYAEESAASCQEIREPDLSVLARPNVALNLR